MQNGENTEDEAATPAVAVEEAAPAAPVIPQQRGPEMFVPPPVSAPPYWPPVVAVPPPAPRNRPLVVAAGGGVAVILVLALVVWVASGGQRAIVQSAHTLPGHTAAPGTSAPAPGKAVPGVSDKILDTLGKQSKALLSGDHDGYLAPVGGGLQDGFNRRYGSLRAMGVQSWTPTLVDKPTEATDGTWSVLVRFDYCFGQGCTLLFPQVVQTSWTVLGDKASIAKYEQTSEPWDASALQAVTGRRVIVAGSAANASKLQRVATKADQAADIADRYAHWDPAPKWYIVYVAGEGEWKSWWDNGDIGASYDGYSTGPRGIVMQASDAGQSWLGSLLSHEFGHVVTVGEEYGGANDWWLVEGIADYISDRDGNTLRGRLPDVRKFVKKGWNGSITLTPPPDNASGAEIDARYGIALLAVSCLAKKYTEPKMLDFFGAVVRKNESLESASTEFLGAEWNSVASYCAGQVRSA